MAAAALLTPPPARAAPDLALKSRIEQENRRLGEVQEKFETVQRKIRVLTSRRQVLETQLAMNRKQRAGIERQIHDLRKQSASAAAQVSTATRELGVAEESYGRWKGEFQDRLVHMYKRSSLSSLQAVIHARSLADFVTRARYYQLLREDAGQLNRLRDSRDEIARRRAERDAARQRADALSASLAARERSLAKNIHDQANLLEQIAREREHEVEKVDRLKEASRILERKIANLNRAAAAVEEERRSAPRPTRTLPKKGELRWPLEGDIDIVRPFGKARNQAGTAVFNSGLDLAVQPQTRVLASAPGRVMFQGVFSPVYGKVVMLDHGGTPVNLITLYGNLDEILVGMDQEVQAGTTLGLAGSSGTRDRPRPLHFEVRRGPEAQDPRKWLSSR